MNKEDLIEEFVENIINLAVANRLTGIWDNRRHEHCKLPLRNTDHQYIYITEKMSRSNVEKRAACKTAIDRCWRELVNRDVLRNK